MCADSGAGSATGGRGSDTSGRQETYSRRYDPAAPGSTRPSFSEAFQYHSVDKFTPEQNVARGVLSFLPGGGAFQLAGAALEASRDAQMGAGRNQNNTPSNISDTDDNSIAGVMVNQRTSRVAAKKASTKKASTETPTLGGMQSVRAPYSRQSTMLTGSKGIMSQPNLGIRTLLG